MTTLPLTLAAFTHATPALLASRQLLRRTDTKFVISLASITEILERVVNEYAVVPVGAQHLASYANLYFDTEGLKCFHDHRRGRRLRHKIRLRWYIDRRLAFLEIKSRRNGMQTEKARLEVPYGTAALDADMRMFLTSRCAFGGNVIPTVAIDYRRIMLVGLETEERVTIDLGVTVNRDGGHAIGAVAIVEVKQPRRSVATPIMRALRSAGHVPCSLSKYVSALAARPGARANLFAPSLRRLERIAREG